MDLSGSLKFERCCDPQPEGWKVQGEAEIAVTAEFEYGVGASIGSYDDLFDYAEYEVDVEGITLFSGLKGELKLAGGGSVTKECGSDDWKWCVFVGGGAELFAGVEGSVSLEFETPNHDDIRVEGVIKGGLKTELAVRYDVCDDGTSKQCVSWSGISLVGEISFELPDGRSGSASVEIVLVEGIECIGQSDLVGLDLLPLSNDFPLVSAVDLARGMGFEDPAEMRALLGMPDLPDDIGFDESTRALDSFGHYYDANATGVCASVTLQIDQEVVLTRTGFEAQLQLINNSTTDPIENLLVEVWVTGLDGGNAAHLFSTSISSLEGMTSVDGQGTLAVQEDGSVTWLLIPSTDAATVGATQFLVGGRMSYTIGGVDVVAAFTAVPITVLPQPELVLTYFMQRDVLGDDPHTAEVESSEPFTLAVMVRNDGVGAANNLRIESAQPKIIENEKGLLVDFEITGTRVNGQALNPTLTAQIGSVEPGQLAIAEWLMESTLQGQFVEYIATFEHLSGLGDNRFSLIKDVQIRELIRSVNAAQVDGDDGLPDFLVNDLPDPFDLPDRLYLSEGSTAEVSLGSNANAASIPSVNNLRINVTAQMDAGWSYVKMADPSLGNLVLVAIERSDGTSLPLNNFWQTDRTFVGGGLRPILENKIHLLDYNSTGSYTFVFSNGDFDGPEVVAFAGVSPNPTTLTIDVVDVEFSEALNPASFTADDVRLTKNGVTVATSALGIASVGNNIYRISGLAPFTAQDAVYELFVDLSMLTDVVGNPGEGTESYRWVRGETSPTILALSGAPSGLTNTVTDAVDVVFSKPIVPASFGLEDISLRRGGEEVLDAQVTIAQLGPTTYRIGNLARLVGSDAEYRLTVNAAGVQDASGVSGIGDSFAHWTLDATAPLLVNVFEPPTSPRNIVVQQIDVLFSEPIDIATFDVSDLSLVRNDGTENLLAGDPRVTIEDRGNNRYRIGGINWVQAFVANPQVAQFTLTIDASGIRDLAGNPATGTASTTWTIDLDRPVPPADLRLFTFTGEVVGGRLSSRFATLTGELTEPGLTIAVLDVTTNTELARSPVSGTSFSLPIVFPSPGQHRLRVRAIDRAGNVSDAFIEDLFIVESAPLVETIEGLPQQSTNQVVGEVIVKFIAPIDPGTLSVDAFSLRRNAGEELLGNQITITPDTANRSFTIAGLNQVTELEGIYELTIDLSAVRDPAGLSGSGLVHISWTTDRQAPTSQVRTLAEIQPRATFVLSVSGSDPEIGSGISGTGIVSYDLYVSENDGAYVLHQTLPVNAASTTFAGRANTSYRFYSLARDAAGNVEAVPSQHDTATFIPELELATIGDRVWLDANANGIQDSGEVGVAGVTVRLYLADSNELLDQTISDDEGLYSFTGLSAGPRYFLEFVAPVGRAFTSPNFGSIDSIDSDVQIETGRSAPFNVIGGANNHWDAGLIELGTVSGKVWWDVTGDGNQQGYEPNMANQVVYLDLNGNGTRDNNEPQAVTDESGAFSFNNLRPGPYTIRYVVQEGWQQTYPTPAGASDTSFTGANIPLLTPGITSFPGVAPNQIETRLDVNGDGQISDEDIESVVALLNARKADKVYLEAAAVYVAGFDHPADVSGDGLVSPLDVLLIVNAINATDSAILESLSGAGSRVANANSDANWAGNLIGLDRLRSDQRFTSLDGQGLSVVVIDTGIDLDHNFFGPDSDGDGVADRIVYQYDFADGDAHAGDRSGHGSHVTSIIASSNARYPGIAPDVEIISLKVFSDSGSGSFAHLERALQWVVANVDTYNIAAVNMSLGDGNNWSTPVGLYGISDELSALSALGVITVSAAGNSFAPFNGQQGLAYPAADPNSLSVGAVWDGDRGFQTFGIYGTDHTTDADRLTSFSQRHSLHLDTLAPGAMITAANATGGVATMRGTSMAAPFVTGAAILAQQASLQEYGRRLTTSQLKQLLSESGMLVFDGDDEDVSVPGTQATYRRLDLLRLIESVLELPPDEPDGNDAPGNDGDGGDIAVASSSGAYQFVLQPGQERFDIRFGTRPIDSVPPKVEQFVIGAGQPQRSMLRSIDIRFDSAVIIDPAAFVLESGDQTVPIQVHFNQIAGQTVAKLTFPPSAFVEASGSLRDGNYRLTTLHTHIRDMSGNPLADTAGNPEASRVDEFFRFYGDFNGNRHVDLIDLTMMRRSLGKSSPDPLFDEAFDFDWDGDADLIDYTMFRRNLGKSLPA